MSTVAGGGERALAPLGVYPNIVIVDAISVHESIDAESKMFTRFRILLSTLPNSTMHSIDYVWWQSWMACHWDFLSSWYLSNREQGCAIGRCTFIYKCLFAGNWTFVMC